MTSLFRCKVCKEYFICSYPNSKCHTLREGDINPDNSLNCICLKCLHPVSKEVYKSCKERKPSLKELIIFKLTQ